MKHLDYLYESLEYGLLKIRAKDRSQVVEAYKKSGSKIHEQAASILEAWMEEHPDEQYQTDYWTEKWCVLKTILVGKRKRKSVAKVVEQCMTVIYYMSRFEITNYEIWLTKWA